MWREPTESDVLGVLNALETAAYQRVAKATGQDVLDDILTQVVTHCRGYIADNPQNALAEGNTLPERVMRPAMHLVRKDLLTRLNMEVSEDRRRDATEAIRFFERVAEGKVTVERPDGETEESGAAPSCETLTSRTRIAGRDNLKGL